MALEVCTGWVAGAGVVIFAAAAISVGLFEGGGLFSIVSGTLKCCGSEGIYLIDGHRGGIVLIIALRIHQFRG